MGVHDVVPGPPKLHHLGEQLWRVLKVGVHGDHDVTSCVLQPRQDGRLVSETPGQAQVSDARVTRVQLFEKRERAVLAAVIHDDELEVVCEFRQDRPQLIDQLFQTLGLIQRRGDDR